MQARAHQPLLRMGCTPNGVKPIRSGMLLAARRMDHTEMPRREPYFAMPRMTAGEDAGFCSWLVETDMPPSLITCFLRENPEAAPPMGDGVLASEESASMLGGVAWILTGDDDFAGVAPCPAEAADDLRGVAGDNGA